MVMKNKIAPGNVGGIGGFQPIRSQDHRPVTEHQQQKVGNPPAKSIFDQQQGIQPPPKQINSELGDATKSAIADLAKYFNEE